jgi:hypothetical protein
MNVSVDTSSETTMKILSNDNDSSEFGSREIPRESRGTTVYTRKALKLEEVNNQYGQRNVPDENKYSFTSRDGNSIALVSRPTHLQHAITIDRSSSPLLYSNQNHHSNNLIRRSIHNQQSGMLLGQQRRVADPNSQRSRQSVRMDIVTDPARDGNSIVTPPIQRNITAPHVAYLDAVDIGRSSAYNSDIDSESDDISFDDSESDRSDGSDFDPALGTMNNLPEPYTAARVMALNRLQQQHRREQYLQDRASRQIAIFQPLPDSEYQSGDSVDSALAEDSCGSDSSSSDFTD